MRMISISKPSGRIFSKLQAAFGAGSSAIDNYIDANSGNDGKFEIAGLGRRSTVDFAKSPRPVLSRTLQFRYQIENCYFVEIKLQFVISVIT